MPPEQMDLYFHGVEIACIVLGMAIPAWINTVQLRRILKDYPPHRHNGDGSITFAKGYDPPREQPPARKARWEN
jgi:hypothetical protein